jgi:hypothetical protein
MKVKAPRRVEVSGVTYEIRVLFNLEELREKPPAKHKPVSGSGACIRQETATLRPGDVVRHRLTPELLGRIVEVDRRRAKIELLARPPDDWWGRWGDGPVPVVLANLVRADQTDQ